jgi:DHA1 family tetracycline resistance protein-like MFS transporter
MHRTKRSPLLLMALTILIDFMGFGLVLPWMPFWAERLGANALTVGLLVTIYSLAQFLFTPVLGSLSDRYGRKPVIFTSLIIEAVSLAFSGLAWSLLVLALARFIGGLGASNIGSAQAVVSDITTPQERARGMGVIGACIGLGFVLGPALGGVLSPLGPSFIFLTAAVIAVINALLVFFFLPETHAVGPQPHRKRETATDRHPLAVFTSWSNLWRYPLIGRLVCVNLLFTIAFTGMEAIFPIFAQHNFSWGAMQTGYIFTYVGVVVVLMQGGLVRQLVKVWREQALLRIGLLLLALGLFLLAFSTQIALLFVSLGILSIGDGAVTPMVSTLLSFASAEDRQGEIQGLAQGMAGLGRILGPVIASSLYALSGPSSPFVAGGILGVLAFVMAIPAMAIQRHASPAPASDNETTTGESIEETSVIKNS